MVGGGGVGPTVRDVLAFHRIDRAAYEQLLSLGASPPPARNAVALLMWLHRRAGVDAVAARRGVAEVLDGVGALVFDDELHALLRRHEGEDEERGGAGGAILPAKLAAPYRGAAAPAAAMGEDDSCRSLFVTFSKGYPLTREEIEEYFTERWGDCLEKVMMEKTPVGELPSYGRIVFRHAVMAAAVLGGERLVKLVLNGRQLWARKYIPRQLQP
uniref:RRM domain-containing protein n=1 Tax=Leersia perrieri TaxID=77586 RepID=A0A0D9W3Z5_9ORYZ